MMAIPQGTICGPKPACVLKRIECDKEHYLLVHTDRPARENRPRCPETSIATIVLRQN